jgi:NAD(P)H-hydrate epimerase
MGAMRPISIAEAQAFDRYAQEKLGIPSIILMENAGRSVAEEALKMLRGKKKVAVICGVGNNGGDGLVAARHLLNAGVKVNVYIIGKISKLKADPKTNFKILKKMKQGIISSRKPETKRLGFQGYDLIIDALFGIGLKSEVREPYALVIDLINKAGRPILSVDAPSGLDADSGKVLGVAVKAKRTVTFVASKKGFSKAAGPKYCGKIVVKDIGVK